MDTSTAIITAFGAASAAMSRRPAAARLERAYRTLKTLLEQNHGLDTGPLEREPVSKAQIAALAAALSSKIGSDAALMPFVEPANNALAATRFLHGLKDLGIDPNDLEAANAAIIDFVFEGSDFKIGHITIGGNFVIDGRVIGVEPAEAWPEPGMPAG